VFTVYPRSSDEALRLARRLHKMTVGLPAPRCRLTLKFREDSSVHYRYGAFTPLEIENVDGTRTPAIRNPDGALVPDSREVATPAWISKCPFEGTASKSRTINCQSAQDDVSRISSAEPARKGRCLSRARCERKPTPIVCTQRGSRAGRSSGMVAMAGGGSRTKSEYYGAFMVLGYTRLTFMAPLKWKGTITWLWNSFRVRTSGNA